MGKKSDQFVNRRAMLRLLHVLGLSALPLPLALPLVKRKPYAAPAVSEARKVQREAIAGWVAAVERAGFKRIAGGRCDRS